MGSEYIITINTISDVDGDAVGDVTKESRVDFHLIADDENSEFHLL
jgi:hypothetical protein